MPPVIPSNNQLPIMPASSEDVDIDDVSKTVLFRNFRVGDSNPKKAHMDFIANFWVPLTIQGINKDRFPVQVMTLTLFGRASATGNKDKNQALSSLRAEAIGDVFEFEFFKQANGLASQVKTIKKNIKPLGDTEARALLRGNPNVPPPKTIEKNQNDFRSVLTSFKMNHSITPAEQVILCRQIIDQQFKVEKPSTTLLGQTIDRLADRTPLLLKLGMQVAVAVVKDVLLDGLKKMLESAENAAVTAPELGIIIKGMEFIVPGDFACFFEFKDVRGVLRKYLYTSTENKIDFSLLDLASMVGSFAKFARGSPGAVEKFVDALKTGAGKRMGMSKDDVDKLITVLKAFGAACKSINDDFKRLTGPGGGLRQALGDEWTDALVRVVESSGLKLVVASPFEPCTFEDLGFPDIGTLSGVARTFRTSRIFGTTETEFDFAARENISLLGFRGHCTFREKRALSLNIGSVDLTRGTLMLSS